MYPVDAAFVKFTLRGFDELTQRADEEMVRISRRIRDKSMSSEQNAFIEAASMPGRSMDGMPGGKSWTMDLQNVFDRYEDIDREFVNSTLYHLRSLTERKEAMNRIMICFRALPEGNMKQVIRIVDIQSESIKAGWIECKTMLDISETVAKRLRRDGIHKILQIYRSPYSNQELLGPNAYKKAMNS